MTTEDHLPRFYVATGKVNVSQLDGLGKAIPFTFFAFFIGACSVIGLPPLGGMWSKYYLSLAAVDTGQLVFIAALMISSLLNVWYLLPIVARGFFKNSADFCKIASWRNNYSPGAHHRFSK